MLRDERDKFRRAAADGFAITAGCKIKDPEPGYEDFRGIGIQDLCRVCLARDKGNQSFLTGNQIASELIRRSAQMSIDDFGSIFLDASNKILQQAYKEAPQTFSPLVNVVSAADFKTIYGVSMSEAPDLDLIGENGEYKAGEISDSNESYSVQTYGKVFYITRGMIVNDDTRALRRIPQLFGAAARRKESDIVWGKITGNPTMNDGTALFHADHSNLASSGAGLNYTSLSAGRAAMRKQTGPAGKHLNIIPRYIIIPAAMETSAEIISRSISLPEDNKSGGVVNPWQSLTPISEPRLDDDSEIAWYLAADPNQVDMIDLAYLGGVQEPYTEEYQVFNRDAIGFKIRHEFGVGLMDYRGLYKNPGA
jgi:hypothetical protein